MNDEVKWEIVVTMDAMKREIVTAEKVSSNEQWAMSNVVEI